MIEENVVRAAGVNFRMTEAEIRRLVEDAGFIPKRRNMTYQFLPDPVEPNSLVSSN